MQLTEKLWPVGHQNLATARNAPNLLPHQRYDGLSPIQSERSSFCTFRRLHAILKFSFHFIFCFVKNWPFLSWTRVADVVRQHVVSSLTNLEILHGFGRNFDAIKIIVIYTIKEVGQCPAERQAARQGESIQVRFSSREINEFQQINM